MKLEIIILLSYLLGSIPFGFIITKIFLNKDIRNIGSGNIGATNVLRTGNKFIGYMTLSLDVLKAVLPLLYIKAYQQEFIYISSLCIFIGHLFPIWLKFKGGKGVATYIGFLLAANYLLCFVFIFCWLIVVFISKYSSLSSIISLMIIPFVAIYLYPFFSSINNYMLIFISIIIILKHYSNILRLFNKKENKISF